MAAGRLGAPWGRADSSQRAVAIVGVTRRPLSSERVLFLRPKILRFMGKKECDLQFPGKHATGYCRVVVFSAAGSTWKNNSISIGGHVVEESHGFLKR